MKCLTQEMNFFYFLVFVVVLVYGSLILTIYMREVKFMKSEKIFNGIRAEDKAMIDKLNETIAKLGELKE